MSLVFAMAAGFTLLLVLLLLSLPFAMKGRAGATRLQRVLHSKTADVHQRRGVSDAVTSLASALRERTGMRHSEQAIEKLHAAGLRTPAQMDSFLAVQWIAPLLGLFAGSFAGGNTVFACVVLAAAGYLLPDVWLRRRIRRYKDRIRRSLPDALDLLNICVEAGLGLDQAVIRVSDELALSHAELQSELQRVQLEQRVGSGRMDAWKRLAARVEIEEISSFVGMLVQSEKFGTPIARALTRFADDLRLQRRQRAEEAAAKTRVKIVFPLVFFIFPCLFIVLLAPAMLSLFGILKDLK